MHWRRKWSALLHRWISGMDPLIRGDDTDKRSAMAKRVLAAEETQD